MELKNKIQIRIKEKPDAKLFEDYMKNNNLTNVSAFFYEMALLGLKTRIEEEKGIKEREDCGQSRFLCLDEKLDSILKRIGFLDSSFEKTDSLISSVGIEVVKGNDRLSAIHREQSEEKMSEEKMLSCVHNYLRKCATGKTKKAIDAGNYDYIPERFKKEELR